MTSILFDATFRSGNHFAVALLKKAFPNIKLYWGYKDKHNPESFNLPKDKFNFYMTSIRKPIDSIASQVLLESTNNFNEIIAKYKLFLESVLNNKEKIHIYSFEDITTKPMKVVENIAFKLNIDFKTVDIDKLIESFKYYNTSNFYVVPTSNKDILDEQDKLVEIKSKLSQKSFTDLMTEVDELYEKLSVFKIKTR
jgi:hypothetical protein|tara:strand:+ start:12 stop:599 length:588 start_codon:yes stop_codon:yes gene_type:complete